GGEVGAFGGRVLQVLGHLDRLVGDGVVVHAGGDLERLGAGLVRRGALGVGRPQVLDQFERLLGPLLVQRADLIGGKALELIGRRRLGQFFQFRQHLLLVAARRVFRGGGQSR